MVRAPGTERITAGHRQLEAGFTLIELLVACFLFVLVAATLIAAMVSMFGGSDELVAENRSQLQATEAVQQLTKDLASARSPGVEEWSGRRDALRTVLFFRTPVFIPPSDPVYWACGGIDVVHCLEDVTHADGSSIWFRANVSSHAAGAECVGYVSAPDGSFSRYVGEGWRACGPARMADSRRTTYLQGGSGATDRVFSYQLRYNPDMVPREKADPLACRSYPPTHSVGNRRNAIWSVTLDFSGITGQRKGASASRLHSTIPLRSRTMGDIPYAMGCSF